MPPPATEQAALQKLLATGIFSRSPNLERILVYLCERHFAGQSEGVKEFHIATEALGRSAEFDSRKDSIVRVEMLRLRRRLKEYSEANPTDVPRISFPEKSYVPEFAWTTPEPVALEPDQSVSKSTIKPPLSALLDTAIPPPAPISRWWIFGFLALATAGVAALVIPFAAKGPLSDPSQSVASVPAESATASKPADTPESVDPRDEVRILAGRPSGRYIDQDGQSWEGDQYVTGGVARAVPGEVNTRGLDPNIFSGMREGVFQYDIPLKPGTYELLLIFAETMDQGKNPSGRPGRLFSVYGNGKILLQDFDAISEAFDPSTATARLFRDITPGLDGKLHLRFVKGPTGIPFVNGILLRSGLPGKLRPIRIVTRTKGIHDSQNNFWESDHFYRGGFQIARPDTPPGPDGELYLGERYGHFSYRIPVPPGKYSVRLHFREYWWGPESPGKGGSGSRVFSVYANHRPLLTDFDILQTTGAGTPVLVKSFTGLEPDDHGQIVLDFVPKVNYALINAIEVLDEQ